MGPIKVIYIAVGDRYGSGIALLNLLKEEVLNHAINPLVIISADNGLKHELENMKISCKVIPINFAIYPQFDSYKNKLLFIPRLIINEFINYISSKKIEKIAIDFNTQIIHTNVGVFRIGYEVAKNMKIPHVWHLREYQDLDMNYHFLLGKNKFCTLLKKEINYPIAISRGISNHFLLNSYCKIIYDGVRSKKLIQFQQKKEKYFLFVGNLSEHKGLDLIIDAFIDFANETFDYELLIVGSNEGDYANLVVNKALNSSSSKRIKFLGYRSDIDNLMAKASSLIVASSFEGFGLITAEAMFNGCLVIGKNTAGTKEQFDNGFKLQREEIGLRFYNQSELTLAMKEIAFNGIEYYFPMIKKAQETALSLYSTETNANQIIELYKKILK